MKLPKVYPPKFFRAKLGRVYNPKKVEDRIYQLWQRSGFFNPDKLPKRNKRSYCIVIPPPNITGVLHMGHALNSAIQDILIRWRRLQGYKTLWLPGTDHAGIATQVQVEKELKKEGKTRFDLGRELFIKKVWQWKGKYGNIILEQLKKLGCSLDWSRTRFTMNREYSKAVKNAFLHYYKKGWIYQGKRVVNWCPRCQTSLSDLEVEYKEELAKLYYIKYGPLTLATVRPETKLGDTAVAVNPRDIRYKKYVGKIIEILSVDGKIKMKVVADKAVDPNFGTGVIKVTPAHDINDFEIGLKNNLPMRQIIGFDGKMNKLAGKYTGLTTQEARKLIVKDMEKLGLIEKVEDYNHRVVKCYRCGTIIEPLPSEQWFLKMAELAKKATEVVKKGKIKFHPKNFEKPYFDWLKNIKDWCISRQIWWGHRIPIKGEIDVLDTWFSSALWPFATLGWPKKTKGLKIFYPTNVLSTDRGIINLWVARMIFSGMEFLKKVPFKDVYIHATVLTKEGKRMSKSLGTGIDPMNLIEKYGADATRFGITWQIMGGQDIRFVEDNIVMGRKFCNKLWNAARFVMLQTVKLKVKNKKFKITVKNSRLSSADRKTLKTLEKTIKSVNENLDSFRFGEAARKLYNFFWHDFCDIYIEKSKKQNNEMTKKILLYVLLTSLKLLHPFVPFITEEIYQKLPLKEKKKFLMIEDWPR